MSFNIEPGYGEIIEHKASGFNLNEVAQELHITLEDIVKAIIMEFSDLKPIICIIRSVDRLKTKNIKQLTGKKFSFMTEEHLNELNLSPGAIPPFIGFQLHYKTYIDNNLQSKSFFYGSGGSVYNACKFNVINYIDLGATFENLTI